MRSFVVLAMLWACDAGRPADVAPVQRAPAPPVRDAAIRSDAAAPDASAATTSSPAAWPRLGSNGFEGVSTAALSSPAGIERAFPGTRVEHPSPYELLVYAGSTQLMLVRLSETAPHLAWMVDVVGHGIETTGGFEVGQPLARVFRRAHSRCETAVPISRAPGTSSDRRSYITCWIDEHVNLGATVARELPPQSGAGLEAWIQAHAPKIGSLRWDSYGPD